MTMSCSNGHRDIELVNDNGATFPETRVEFYECATCGESFKKVLSA